LAGESACPTKTQTYARQCGTLSSVSQAISAILSQLLNTSMAPIAGPNPWHTDAGKTLNPSYSAGSISVIDFWLSSTSTARKHFDFALILPKILIDFPLRA
jgi:hypothetical protein